MDMTLREWVDLWLAMIEKTRAKNTYLIYSKGTQTFGELMNKKLTELTPKDILLWNMTWPGTDKGKARNALVLKTCLAGAVKMKLLAENPVPNLFKPSRIRPVNVAWTPAQTKKFLEEAKGSKYENLFYLAIMTGARIGELLGLRYEDLVGQDLRIERQALEIRGARSIGYPKSGSRRLHLSIADRMRFGTGKGYVFANKNGQPTHKSSIYTEFYRVIAAAHVPRINFHSLRHINASYLLSSGIPVTVVSERLGHAKVSTTLNIYAHSLPSRQEEASAAIGKLLG